MNPCRPVAPVLQVLLAPFLATVLALSLLLSGAPAARAEGPGALPPMKVWKTPTCGCCGKWVDIMKAAGFTVEVTNMDDVSPIKTQNGIPPRLSSCHTAVVGGYVVEGHVPVEDVKRLLKEKPAIRGITVPNMPMGSPGMEGPMSEPYDTLALGEDGKVTIYASHGR